MKIIKHGESKTEQKEYELKCPNCGCQFKFTDEEIEAQEKKLDGDAWIHCPDCKIIIIFKPSEHQDIFVKEENE